MNSKTTLRDVASHLSLSPGLVSRVLNDKPGVWASEQTRARILEAAQQLDYRPSSSARALATGRSMQIALLIEIAGKEGDSILSQPDVQGLLEAAARRGYRVVLLPLQPGEAGTRQLEDLAREKWCDGVCLFSHQLSATHLAVLEKHEIPRVLIGDWKQRENAPGRLSVRIDHDNYRYAHDSVMWLHAQGHTRIAWATGTGAENQGHTRELRRGYRDAIAEIGANEQILPIFDSRERFAQAVAERDFSAIITRYLHGAFSWVHAARLNGLNLPDDLAILAQMEAAQTDELYLSGFAGDLALHLYDSRRAGEQAGEILMNWAAGQSPQNQLILIAPQTPFWGRDAD